LLNLVQLSTRSGVLLKHSLRAFSAPALARTLFCCFYRYSQRERVRERERARESERESARTRERGAEREQ